MAPLVVALEGGGAREWWRCLCPIYDIKILYMISFIIDTIYEIIGTIYDIILLYMR